MWKTKINIVGISLIATLLIGAVAYASNDTIVKDILGAKSFKIAKEEVTLDGKSQKKFDDIRLKANKLKKPEELKKVDEVVGLVPEGKLDRAQYKFKQLMTYEESYNQGYTNSIIYEIDPDRMVWVVQLKSHKELDYEGHKIKNPLITNIYDAETGETITFSWQAEG